VIINQGRIAVEDQIENLTRDMSLEEVFLRYISANDGGQLEGGQLEEAGV
jgi:hypothetical protein